MNRALAVLMVLAVLAGCSKSQNTASNAAASPSTVSSIEPSPPASSASPEIQAASPEAGAASPVGTAESPEASAGAPEAIASGSVSAVPQAEGTEAISGSAPPATAGNGLSAAEVQYGVAPTRNPNVTYNPDVVIPDGGANSVHSVSSDGLTWTIDANAGHASDLAVGKILFITNRGVGRVLALTRTGNDLAVTLGPVEITEVIQEAHLASNGVALDPSSMYSYVATDFPGAVINTSQTAFISQPQVRFADYDDAGDQVALSLPGVTGSGPPPSTQLNDYTFNAFCCGGLGVQVAHKGSDLQILARAVLRLGHPSVDYKLDISGGKIQTAIVILHGTVGLDMHFEASTPPDAVGGNANRQFYVPVDLSFPIGGLAVPLALTVHQQFLLKTGFGAKNSSLNADLSIGFGGDMNAGYQNGSWGLNFPDAYSDATPGGGALNAVSGVALGSAAVEIAYEGKVIVGIGAFGFVTGPYVGFDAAYGVVHGADAAIGLAGPVCNAATLKTDAVAGVGYSIPQTVTKAINKILHALNIAPIKSSGGLNSGKTIYSKHLSRPNNCA